MNTSLRSRRSEKLLGLFFILPFPAFGIGSALLEGLIASGAPGIAAAARPQLVAGTVLVLFNSWLVLSIGVLLFPVLRANRETTAVAYLVARLCEALLLAVGPIAFLILAGLPADSASSLGPLLVSAKGWAYEVGMLALGVGSVPMCLLLWRARLVPAPLAAVGTVGYVALALGALGELAGWSVGVVASVPGGLFELTLGGWLLVKGFRSDGVSAASPAAPEFGSTTRA